ncbi:MAG: preprotein translocase subunit SecY, partial [Malacoplasma sp.]|nr:preprotein translocase subunit SecY [Malacoplasma sp.]
FVNMNNTSKYQNKKSFWVELKQIFTNKQVLVSFIATLVLLILFRIGSSLTMPGLTINTSQQENAQQSFLGILNLLGGGGVSRLSFMAIGVSPYITAQIIIQLLSSDLIKPLTRLSKAGERGKKKLEVITRLLTIPFAIMQAYAVLSLAGTQGLVSSFFGESSLSSVNGGQVALLLLGMTAGTFLTLFISDIISKRGVGNGVTLIILSGIVSSIYPNFSNVYVILTSSGTINNELLKYFSFIVYLVFFIIILLATTFMNGSVRKIPIQQIGQGLSKEIDEMPYLPIKLNAAGVIPVIFASSIMTIAPTISQFLPSNSDGVALINNYLSIETPVGLTIYAVLIVLFGFFYSHIQVNSEKLSENFQKSGKFIPGVKMGEETQKYISRTLNRINCIGVPFLTIIAIIPYLITITTSIPNGIAIGGTGVIIMVTGSLEFWSSLKSSQTNYTYSNLTKGLKKSNEYEIQGNKQENSETKRLW